MTAQQQLHSIARIVAIVEDGYQELAKKHGLTYNQLLTYCELAERKNVTSKDLVATLKVPKTTVSSLIKGMVTSGDVELVAGEDKREKIIRPTAIGQAKITSIIRDVQAVELATVEAYGADKVQRLIELADVYAQEFYHRATNTTESA